MQKKTILVMVFVLATIVTVFAQTVADFNVTLTEDGKGVVIAGYTGTATAVRIPATIEGMPVREIGEKAFALKNITSVVIPQGVTIIRFYAFSQSTYGMRGDDKLVQVTLPSTLQIIESSAFSCNKGLKSIVIPEGVTEIGGSAFADCSALASVTLPQSLVKLGIDAFNDTAITSITLPPKLTRIAGGTFGRTKLKSIVIPEGVTEIGDSGERSEVGDGITINGAFGGCTALTSVTFPSTIQRIGIAAFSNCSALTTVTIPDSVQTIDFTSGYGGYEGVFEGCHKLNLASQATIKQRGYTGSF
jgi:hypothetical protein